MIFWAQYEASKFGSLYIETEHMLLGLLREDQGLANRMERSGDTIESIRKHIEGQRPAREKIATSVDLPLSQECKRVLVYAAEEAERFSYTHIGTEHLLLGLLREKNCLAAKILQERGLRVAGLGASFRRAERPPTIPAGVAAAAPLSVIIRDLVEAAAEDELDPLVGREDELEQVTQSLCRRAENNPVLVGEPGVGKTAIVHGLAQRIANGDVPTRLQGKLLLALDFSPILAVAGDSKRLEERVLALLQELIEAANLIVFIEDLFVPVGSPALPKIVNFLKPLLTQGEIQCIAAATAEDYRKATEEEAWLAECFSAVEVPPRIEAEALKMLAGIKQRYEQFHKVVYTDEALQFAVSHSQRYIPGRCLPDRAIDLIDEAAGAAVALRAGPLPEDVRDTEKRLKFVISRVENAISNHEFQKARFYSDEERKERENLRELRAKYNLDAKSTVTLDDIENVVARRTGVPITRIRQERGTAGPGGDEGKGA